MYVCILKCTDKTRYALIYYNGIIEIMTSKDGRTLQDKIEVFLQGPKAKIYLVLFAGFTIGYMMHGLKVYLHLVK